MPIRSTASSLARRPAVSSTRTGTPSMKKRSSITSRVVPADRRHDRAFFAEQRVEQRRLPGVGRTDDRERQALAHEPAALPIRRRALQALLRTQRGGRRRPRGRVRALRPDSRSRRRVLRAPSRAARATASIAARKPPVRFACAARAPARDSASITSATASAALRSSLPLRNARRVNSPGPAARAPACNKRAQRFARDHRAAVHVQFDDVFARHGARRVHREREARDRAPRRRRRGSRRRSQRDRRAARGCEKRAPRSCARRVRCSGRSRSHRAPAGSRSPRSSQACYFGRNDQPAIGVDAFGFGAHDRRFGEREMHDLAFARQHRLEFDRFAFANHAFERRERERLELIGFARAIAFGVDRVVAAVVAHAGVEDVVEDQVERFERVAVAADQIRQPRPANFEVLAFRTRDVDDRDVVDAHLAEQLFEQRARGLRAFGRFDRRGGRRTRRCRAGGRSGRRRRPSVRARGRRNRGAARNRASLSMLVLRF